MRRNIVMLTAGLALVISFCAPATAQAAETSPYLPNCSNLQNVGTQTYGSRSGGNLSFWPVIDAYYPDNVFCNHSIAINGEFEIRLDESDDSCLGINSTTGLVVDESAKACSVYGGDGYPWDRWTAIRILYHSNTLWVLRNAGYPGYCLHADQPNASYVSAADWVPCNSSDHWQWFSWPGSNL